MSIILKTLGLYRLFPFKLDLLVQHRVKKEKLSAPPPPACDPSPSAAAAHPVPAPAALPSCVADTAQPSIILEKECD